MIIYSTKIGHEPGNLPPFREGFTNLVAIPHRRPVACVAAPDAIVLDCFHGTLLVSSTSLARETVHVMPSLWHHYGIDRQNIADARDPDTFDEQTIFEVRPEESAAESNMLLQAYWAGAGFSVAPVGVVRIRPAIVVGQLPSSFAPGTGKLVTDEGWYLLKGGGYIIHEFDGSSVRFVSRAQMQNEFRGLSFPGDPHMMVNFHQPYTPVLAHL